MPKPESTFRRPPLAAGTVRTKSRDGQCTAVRLCLPSFRRCRQRGVRSTIPGHTNAASPWPETEVSPRARARALVGVTAAHDADPEISVYQWRMMRTEISTAIQIVVQGAFDLSWLFRSSMLPPGKIRSEGAKKTNTPYAGKIIIFAHRALGRSTKKSENVHRHRKQQPTY